MRLKEFLGLIDENLQQLATESGKEVEEWKNLGHELKRDFISLFGDEIDDFYYHQFKKLMKNK